MILSTKKVITRKDHICDGCLRKFPKGTEMVVDVSVYDGINTFRTCMTCDELLTKYPKDFVSDWTDNTYEEGCVAEVIGEKTPEEYLEERQAKSKYSKNCPKCKREKTYGQLITDEWYCWACHYKGES